LPCIWHVSAVLLTLAKVPVEDPKRKKNDDHHSSRRIESGWAILDNNGVNFVQALIMSLCGMAIVGWYWGVPLSSILPKEYRFF
jgi:hypothetical protein